MFYTIITVLVASLIVGDAQNVDSKTVKITQGPVRGYKVENSNVFEFYGIPYATAPTGEDKFKAPLAAPVWDEIFEAVDNTIICHQNSPFPLNEIEDCLVVNVHVPDTEETNLPVLVYIHGGAYFRGFGTMASPKPLVESKKLVAVTLNYRLGAHGFLCLGTEDIPGNAGLKDMVAALRWVKDNIASFGGNPDDVTLAGYSAGSSAAEHLSLSKAAEGLFNKLILESGAATGWGVQTDPIKIVQDHARKLNFTNVGNLAALEEFYKTIPYDLLLSDESVLENFNSDFVFVPCIEKDFGQVRILDDSPVNIIKSGEYKKLPILFGYANMEGMFRMPQFDLWAPRMNEKFSDFLLAELDFESDDQQQSVSQTIKEFYFGDNAVGLYTLFNYLDFFGDVTFAYPILRSVKLRTEAGDEQIYLYEYAFYNKFAPISGVPDILVNFPGAGHGSQTEAVLDAFFQISVGVGEEYTEEYLQNRAQMRELWVNFITTGTPVPEGSAFPAWPPTDASLSPHMILGDTIELGGALNADRAQFWDDIYDRHYRHPIPPVFEESDPVPDKAVLLSGSIILNVSILILAIMVSAAS